MKKADLVWLALLAGIVFFIVSPWTNPQFIALTTSHPYLGGFIKFMILASMGELLAGRIKAGHWIKPLGFIYHAIIWGFFGMLITLLFKIFASGIAFCMAHGYLPGGKSQIAFAFQTSLFNNLFFAPVFMAIHKLTDTYIELRLSGRKPNPTMDDVLNAADWQHFVNFVLFKTIPFFWIPAHTLTFMLPEEYRIVVAAMYSVVLGALLSVKKGKVKR